MLNNSFYSFTQLIEDVKQEIGYSNMRPFYNEIRNLISRAEYDINPYSGFLRRKRMIYNKGNGNFDGKNIKIPGDYVMLDEKGMCADGLCGNKIYVSPSHIVICDTAKRDKVAFNYWALQCDGEGNPVIPMNHKEAIISFVIFKMYSSKVFNGEGSSQQRREYKVEWEDQCMASRGHDAMPTDKGMQAASQISKMSRIEMDAKFCQDYCSSNSCIETYDDTMGKIWVIQLNGQSLDIDDENDVTDDFLEQQVVYSENQVKAGFTHSFAYLGRYGFVIEGNLNENLKIIDILGQDIISAMNIHIDEKNKRIIFVSREFITPSSIYFKLSYE